MKKRGRKTMPEVISGSIGRSQKFVKKASLLSTVIFVVVVGAVFILLTHAQSISTVSGTMWNDANRNGQVDAGETPFSGHTVWLFDSNGNYIAQSTTDANGAYSFSNIVDGTYTVRLVSSDWWTLQQNYVFTTIPYSLDAGETQVQPVTVAGADVTANFGLRQVVRSTDLNTPLSTYKAPSGMICNSYDDVFTAQDWCNMFTSVGSLTNGPEASTQKIYFDYPGQTATDESYSYAGNNAGSYCCFESNSWISYTAWTGGYGGGSGTFWHEYGHAWGNYNAVVSQQDPSYTAYLKERGLYGDSRLYSTKAWSPDEMLAEDYRLLFGSQSPNNQNYPYNNPDVPDPRTVPGLKDWLANTFTKPPALSLTAPTNVAAKAVSQSEVDLTWSAVSGAVKYNVYRNGSLVGFTNDPSTTFADVNLKAATSYSYYVKAVDAYNNLGPVSATVSATTLSPDTTPPTSPGNLKASNITKSSVTLSWTASTDNVGVVGYRVYQVTTSRKSSYSTLIASTTNTSYTVTGLSPGTGYSYYVVAYDAAGNQSTPSNTLNIKTLRR